MILIIDSDNTSELKTRRNFEAVGYKAVVVAKTAAQAREVLNTSEPGSVKDPGGAKNAGGAKNPGAAKNKASLIIINSELDDGNGFTLCREIRKTEKTCNASCNVHIIMLISSAKNQTAIEKTNHSGADSFAVKPYDSDIFFKYIAQYVQLKTVLLVEDDPLIRQMLCAILSKYDMEIIEIDNGIEAHNLINSISPVCLVVLDIGLPGMNGVKIVSSIRSKANWKKTPIVMLTSSTEPTDVKGALSSGANDYVVKPFNIDDFEARMARYLRSD
ncbi:hypothetical protein MNBD_GAMMA10-1340 [hydrothermal vent metagenome]|uniref:Response regulatory domain-containing protein n=1 Tax=hydrothermal vent metagenome TaxID=652676 RepID=A0A3B0XNB5_9ZZZZ